MNYLHALLDWLQKPFLALSVAVVAGFLLFGPDIIRKQVGAHLVRLQVVFFASCAVVIAQTLTLFWIWFKDIRRKRLADNKTRQRLHQLTQDEKAILSRYIDRQARTQDHDPTFADVANLCREGILIPLGTKMHGRRFEAFVISDLAWQYLNKHPDLLNGP